MTVLPRRFSTFVIFLFIFLKLCCLCKFTTEHRKTLLMELMGNLNSTKEDICMCSGAVQNANQTVCYAALIKREWSSEWLVCQFVGDILNIYCKSFCHRIKYLKLVSMVWAHPQFTFIWNMYGNLHVRYISFVFSRRFSNTCMLLTMPPNPGCDSVHTWVDVLLLKINYVKFPGIQVIWRINFIL